MYKRQALRNKIGRSSTASGVQHPYPIPEQSEDKHREESKSRNHKVVIPKVGASATDAGRGDDLAFPNAYTAPQWEDVMRQPCPFQPGKLVRDTHFFFSGVSALDKSAEEECLNSYCPVDIATLVRAESAAFASTYNQRLVKHSFATAEANLKATYLMYAGEICEEEPTSFDDQLALLPEGYESARAVETVLMLLAYRRQYGHFLPGEFRWGWCRESLTPAKRTHVAVSVAGCSTISFDEFPNQKIRANRYIVALYRQSQ